MRLTGAQIVMECLAREGVEVIFGYPGGANLPLYDTLIQYPQIRHILDVEDIASAIREAFYIATTGRPGPVLVDIPRDVQQQTCEFEYPDTVDLPGYKPTTKGHPQQIKKAAQLIAEAERPLILAGH